MSLESIFKNTFYHIVKEKVAFHNINGNLIVRTAIFVLSDILPKVHFSYLSKLRAQKMKAFCSFMRDILLRKQCVFERRGRGMCLYYLLLHFSFVVSCLIVVK